MSIRGKKKTPIFLKLYHVLSRCIVKLIFPSNQSLFQRCIKTKKGRDWGRRGLAGAALSGMFFIGVL